MVLLIVCTTHHGLPVAGSVAFFPVLAAPAPSIVIEAKQRTMMTIRLLASLTVPIWNPAAPTQATMPSTAMVAGIPPSIRLVTMVDTAESMFAPACFIGSNEAANWLMDNAEDQQT